jgi:hypothetical protein
VALILGEGKLTIICEDWKKLKRSPDIVTLGTIWLMPTVSLLVLLMLGLFDADGLSGTVKRIEVTKFQPAVPNGPERQGNCWTNSIAVTRSDAWRCMAGNQIYDPCFSSHSLKGAVICDANRATGTRGFTVKLTKPLPLRSPQAGGARRPWPFKLADGSTCEIRTGTIAFVAGLEVPYGCSDSSECSWE